MRGFPGALIEFARQVSDVARQAHDTPEPDNPPQAATPAPKAASAAEDPAPKAPARKRTRKAASVPAGDPTDPRGPTAAADVPTPPAPPAGQADPWAAPKPSSTGRRVGYRPDGTPYVY
jgi:hypothetical protein